MNKNFSRILRYITNPKILSALNSGINLYDELEINDKSDIGVSRKINAAFLTLLSGEDNPDFEKAVDIFNDYQNHTNWKNLIEFYKTAFKCMDQEIAAIFSANTELAGKFETLANEISNNTDSAVTDEVLIKIHELFFPEDKGLDQPDKFEEAIDALRQKRSVRITKINPDPIDYPAKQILFTSNILTTLPLEEWDINTLDLSFKIREQVNNILNEAQKYWYDHPIPIGIRPDKNEALYGLKGLNGMMEFEKSTGRVSRKTRLTCLLSISTTHDGLHDIVKDYFKDEFKKNDEFKNLDIFIFTEKDTTAIVEQILIPLADRFLPGKDNYILTEIFGVDGEYGRHYSFLKSIAAFWQVFINPDIKATFKIDLDQVFPQETLVKETGNSALDHFKSPLWGARGIDNLGKDIDLSLIAGALVNQYDIDNSLFSPDVSFPDKFLITPETLIFNSKFPQALSTEAEMMTRYKNGFTIDKVIHRIHVTGGTNGILVKALRKYRPFTPSVIGRAEDQAYLLSVMFKSNPVLRYLHKPGLIMRHDKKSFASEAIAAAAAGKLIGDYIRILTFSDYVRALPWDFDKIKSEIDPFTGAFVSKIPVTLVMLRFALKVIELSEKNDPEFVLEFVNSGSERLFEWIDRLKNESTYFEDIFKHELQGWNVYYDLLDLAEEKLNQQDAFIEELKNKTNTIIEKCRIKFE